MHNYHFPPLHIEEQLCISLSFEIQIKHMNICGFNVKKTLQNKIKQKTRKMYFKMHSHYVLFAIRGTRTSKTSIHLSVLLRVSGLQRHTRHKTM